MGTSAKAKRVSKEKQPSQITNMQGFILNHTENKLSGIL
jgi:hypothetical protein